MSMVCCSIAMGNEMHFDMEFPNLNLAILHQIDPTILNQTKLGCCDCPEDTIKITTSQEVHTD